MAMASEPDVVNLTKEQQENLAEYILSVLKSIQTNKVEFNKNIKNDDYKAIFTGSVENRLKYFTIVGNITQREINYLKDYKDHLIKNTPTTTMDKLFEEADTVERYIYIIAVLAAGTNDFPGKTKKDNRFEYYTSLRILKRKTKSLEDVFSIDKQKKYNKQLADLADKNVDDLVQAVQTKVITIKIKSLNICFSWQFTSQSLVL